MPFPTAETNGSISAKAAGEKEAEFELDTGDPQSTEDGGASKLAGGQEHSADNIDHGPAGGDDEDVEKTSHALEGMTLDGGPKKKKSRKKPAKSKKAITGFEEFYADAPTLPHVASEEKDIVYSPVVPLTERIDECLQRYRASRRLDNARGHVLNSFLTLGGIDTTIPQFSGRDQAETKTATAEKIRHMTAGEVIRYGTAGSKYFDPDDPAGWEVDIVSVAKCFMSRIVPGIYLTSGNGFYADCKHAANVLINFLNYVLMHDVCPEYKHQLHAAKAVCDIAPDELRQVREISSSFHELNFENLRGGFNRAAWFLFGEGAINHLDETIDEEKQTQLEWEQDDSSSMRLDPMTRLIVFRLAILLDPDMSDEVKQMLQDGERLTEITVLHAEPDDYEVMAVERLSRRDRHMIQNAFAEKGYKNKFSPAGKLVLRRSIIGHGHTNRPRPDEVDWTLYPREKVYLEDIILAKVVKGMKMRLVLCQLSIGVKIIKECLDVRVSFDTFLPQMLLSGWRDPVPSGREAPSVENCKAEQQHLDRDGPDE